ncbi:MAG: ComEA family DNA-binding protein [Lachnospiraceae bacterium]|nr:ComEA family DNA-binding protein [Lachnospiraceae bacterium]
MRIKYRVTFTVGLIALLSLTGCGRSDAPVVLESLEESVSTEPGDTRFTEDSAPTDEKAPVPAEDVSQTVVVHVCGAVREPGVYELPKDARVADALLAAGDFAADADTDYWNQAAYLTDGQQVYVPTEEETAAAASGGENAGQDGMGGQFLSDTASGADTSGRININTATAAQLKSLPGIGDVKAASIIAYRESKGAFSDVSEIQQVDGIKEGLYRQICDLICVR